MNKYNYKKLNFAFLCSLFLLTSISLTSCLDNTDDSDFNYTPSAAIALYNGSAYTPTLNILVNGVALNQPFNFSDFRSYSYVQAGNNSFKFVDYSTSDSIIGLPSYNFKEGKTYSIFVTSSNDSTVSLVTTTDEGLENLGYSEAAIRFINLCPSFPQLSLRIRDENESLFSYRTYKSVSSFIKTEASIATYELFDPTAEGDQVIAKLENIRLNEARYYTIIAEGVINPDNEDIPEIKLSYELTQ